MPKILASIILLILSSPSLFAHAVGEDYVFLEFHDSYIEGRFEMSYGDLKEKFGIDLVVNGAPSKEILDATAAQVQAYLRNHFSIGPNPTSSYELQFTGADLFAPEGGWAQYHFRLDADPIPPQLHIANTIGFEGDWLHRSVLVLEEGDWPAKGYKMQISMVFSPSNSVQILDTVNPPEVMNPSRMVWQGMLHIWIGIDHILFLLALALPIVLVRRDNSWVPAPQLRRSLIPLLKIVTVFTLAHSVTLLLASLDIISVSSRLVESIIALSIILVALNNIFGRNHRTSLVVILVLGLFHGLGFASVMGDLPFRIAEFKEFILMILGFNLGVEIGQVAILVLVFPLLFLLRERKYYPPVVLTGVSAALALVAGYWFFERAFGL